MSTMKWIVLIMLFLLGIFTAGIGWVPLAIWLGWNYVKLIVKYSFYAAYLFVRLPLYFYIEVPINYFKIAFVDRNISDLFKSTLTSIPPALAVSFLMAVLLPFSIAALAIPLMIGTALFGIGAAIGGGLVGGGGISSAVDFVTQLGPIGYFMIVSFPVVLTMFFAVLKVKINNVVSSAAETGASAANEALSQKGDGNRLEGAGEYAKEGAEQYKNYKNREGVFRAIDAVEEADQLGGEGNIVLQELPGDIVSGIENLPFASKLPSFITGAGVATTVVYILAFVLITIVIVGYAGFLIFALMAGILSVVGPFLFSIIAQPVLAAMGLGGDYANYFGDRYGVEFVGGGPIGGPLSPAVEAYQDGKERVFCLLSGPECLAEAASRPDSKEVGQTYGLRVKDFGPTSSSYNIQNSRYDEAIPFRFTLVNPLRGQGSLDPTGINAYNVSYRIQMIDESRGGSNPYCDTGWIKLNTGRNLDLPNDPDAVRNDILKGDPAQSGRVLITKKKLDNQGVEENRLSHPPGKDSAPDHYGEALTIANCEQLQPGQGRSATARMYLMYDYSSIAQVNFEAMRFENFESGSGREVVSKTADTPVQSAVRVREPFLYEVRPKSGLQTSRRNVVVTLNAERSDVNFRVEDLSLRVPRYLEEGGAVCELSRNGNTKENNVYRLSSDTNPNIIVPSDSSPFFTATKPQDRLWFSMKNEAPELSCDMRLKEEKVNQISESGETLQMEIDTNYTLVETASSSNNIRFRNGACDYANCPFLLSLSQDAEEDDYDFQNVCKGAYSTQGCTAVSKGDVEQWRSNYRDDILSANDPDGTRSHGPDSDTVISDGDVVIRLDMFGRTAMEIGDEFDLEDEVGNPPVGGVDASLWNRIDFDMDGMPHYMEDSEDLENVEQSRNPIKYYRIVQYRNRYNNEVEVELQNVDLDECILGDFPSIPATSREIHEVERYCNGLPHSGQPSGLKCKAINGVSSISKSAARDTCQRASKCNWMDKKSSNSCQPAKTTS